MPFCLDHSTCSLLKMLGTHVLVSFMKMYCYVFFAEELGSKLDQYIATLSVPVFAIRSPERTGLIRARLKGIYFILTRL